MITRNKLGLLAAVALTISASVHAAAADATDTYFVGNSLQTAAPRSFGPTIYAKDQLDLSGYHQLYIEEMQFQYAADAAQVSMSESQKSRIAQSARQSLVQ